MTDEKRTASRPVLARVETRAVPVSSGRVDVREEVAAPRERATRGRTGRASVTEDVVGVTSLSALGSATERPSSLERQPTREQDRLTRSVRELAGAVPGLEGPLVHALLRYGEPALGPLVRAFPGAPWFNRKQTAARLPKGRGVSGIAVALVEFGPPAVSHVRRLLQHADADTRYFAWLVYLELDPDDVCEQAAALTCDPDPGVSNVAILALKAHPQVEARARAMEPLHARLGQPDAPNMALLRTFGVLRDPDCVPHVAGLLEHADPQVAEAAARILRAITARDLGRQARTWREWYQRHAQAPRVAWLLEAAASRCLAERKLAAEELRSLLGEGCAFVPEAGWWARRRALAALSAQLARQAAAGPLESGDVARDASRRTSSAAS